MNNKYFLQWFGFKAEGLITSLFVMGAILHFTNSVYPVGEITLVVAIILLAVDIVIVLDEKAKKSKRGW